MPVQQREAFPPGRDPWALQQRGVNVKNTSTELLHNMFKILTLSSSCD